MKDGFYNRFLEKARRYLSLKIIVKMKEKKMLIALKFLFIGLLFSNDLLIQEMFRGDESAGF